MDTDSHRWLAGAGTLRWKRLPDRDRCRYTDTTHPDRWPLGGSAGRPGRPPQACDVHAGLHGPLSRDLRLSGLGHRPRHVTGDRAAQMVACLHLYGHIRDRPFHRPARQADDGPKHGAAAGPGSCSGAERDGSPHHAHRWAGCRRVADRQLRFQLELLHRGGRLRDHSSHISAHEAALQGRTHHHYSPACRRAWLMW